MIGDLEKHLKTAWERRKTYVTTGGLDAYRLASREELAEEIAVDVYGENAVFQLYDDWVSKAFQAELENILSREYRLKKFFYKRRFRVKDAPEAGGDLKAEPFELEVKEYGHKFIVNLSNYLDSGLFLDHRETRRRVEQMTQTFKALKGHGPNVLNLFAYTGSFSVYAASGGAEMTHTVDLSKTYCDWARRNLDLNGFDKEKNWVYRMDTFEFYKYAKRKGMKFDIIVIDPPTFSRNKSSMFSVQKDQIALIEGAGKLLNDGGQIIFSNNCLEFVMEEKLKNEFQIKDIQHETVPLDFWIDTQKADFWNQGKQIHNCFLITKK